MEVNIPVTRCVGIGEEDASSPSSTKGARGSINQRSQLVTSPKGWISSLERDIGM